jgi:hypothetical protein
LEGQQKTEMECPDSELATCTPLKYSRA